MLVIYLYNNSLVDINILLLLSNERKEYWLDIRDKQLLPPLHMFINFNHNYISYSSQIYCIVTWTRVWGFGPNWEDRTILPLVRTRYTRSIIMVALA
jgi:hypothetical protein